MEALRQRWTAGRGDGWQPVAAVQAKAAEMARFRVSAAVLGLLWFITTVGLMALLTTTLVLLKGELNPPFFVDAGSGLFLPLLFGLLLGVPPSSGSPPGSGPRRSAAAPARC